jgi:NADH-dependant formate dehydrogenase delta subunit FdsD.
MEQQLRNEREPRVTKAPIDKLVMMANQIAQFFGSYPRDEAIAGVASHIEAFWTPKMIQVLKDGIDELPNVNPLVREALAPEVAARDPAEKAAAGPGKVGELGAVDAG